MKNKFRLFGGSLLLLAAMTACSENEWIEDVQNPYNAIQFSASAGKQTRGVIVDDASIKGTPFGIYAYNTKANAWKDDVTGADIPEPNFMKNLAVSYNTGTNAWTYTPTKYWPVDANEKISFFAYWPLELAEGANVSDGIGASEYANDPVAAVKASVADDANATIFPTLTFTQRTKADGSIDASAMKDFIVARSLNQSKQSTSVTLPFKHVLTRVNFTAATETDYGENDKVYITGLKIKGATSNDKSRLFASAAYTLKGKEENSTWNTDAATKSAEDLSVTDILKTVTVSDPSEVGSTSVTGVVLNTDGTDTDLMQTGTDGKHYLFLIPPYGKEGVKANTDIKMEISYTVVTKHPDRNDEITQSSETVTIPMPTGSLQEGVAYNIRFLIGLSAVTLVPTVSSWAQPDDVTEANYRNVDAIKGSKNGSYMKDLHPAANCVMISIPTAGKTLYKHNPGVCLNLNQAYLGWEAIEALENDGKKYAQEVDQIIRAKDFEIVTLWNDSPDANTGGSLSSDYMITGTDGYGEDQGFVVDPDISKLVGLENYFHKLTFGPKIENGQNVMIAMKFVAPKATPANTYTCFTDGDIIWSWHYWITDYQPGETQEKTKAGRVHAYDNAAFQTGGLYKDKVMMDRNLGATVKGLSTTEDIDPSEITADDAVKYFGLYYQHGRKDPFRYWPSGTTPADKYGAGNINQANSNVDLSVKNPDKFFDLTDDQSKVGNWTKETESLWGIAYAPKSVFDPSPAGWRVPVGGLTAICNPWSNFDDENVFEKKNDNNKMNLGRLYSGNSISAWYPAAGCRGSRGSVVSQAWSGFNWGASVYSYETGYYLTFSSSSVNLQSTDCCRAYGFPIRCVKE